ncbi:centromere protein F-like isoform X2 [Sycon ciliatum]|uniref:centromere protein F-like isoform X2 n=1 Tax=Sycon ciliatum TaxID=27933 RepID=UPI0031F61E39
MSWVQEEWKDGLAPSVLHKIDQLERQTEQLRKENQQRRFQVDTLEQALRKQKKAVEEEKQVSGELKGELQSVTRSNCELEQKLSRHENDQSRQLAAERSALGSLKSRNIAAQELLKKRESEARVLTERCNELTSDLGSCREELVAASTNMEKLTDQMAVCKNELRMEKENSAVHCRDLEKVNASLANDLVDLQEQLRGEKANCEATQNRNEELTRQVNVYAEQASELCKERDESNATTLSMKVELEELKSTYDAAALGCTSATELARSLQERLDASERLCSEAAEEMGPLGDQLASYKDQVDSLTVERDQLLEHSNAAQALLEQLEDARMDSEQRYSDLLATVEVNGENQSLSADVLEAKDEQLSLIILEKENISSQLQIEADQVAKLTDQNENLENQLEAANDQLCSVSTQLSAASQSMERMEQEISEQANQLSSGTAVLRSKDEQLQTVTQEFTVQAGELHGKLETLEIALTNKENQYIHAQTRITDLSRELEQRTHDHQAELESVLKDLEQREGQSEQLEQLQMAEAQLNNELGQLKHAASARAKENEQLQVERDEAILRCETAASKNNDLSERLSQLSGTLSACQEDNGRLSSCIDEERRRNSSLEDENGNLASQAAALSTRATELEAAMHGLEEQAATTTSSLETEQQAHAKTKATLLEESAEERVKLGSEIDSLSSQLSSSRAEVAELMQKQSAADNIASELRVQLNNVMAENGVLSTEMQDTTQQAARLEEKLQLLEEEYSGIVSQLDGARNTLQAKEDMLSNMQGQVETLEAECSQCKADAQSLAELTEQLGLTQSSLTELTEQLQSVTEEKVQATELVTNLAEDLSQKNNQLDCLVSEFSDSKASLVTMTNDLRLKDEELSTLKIQLTAAQEEQNTLQGELLKQQDLHNELELKLDEARLDTDNATAANQALCGELSQRLSDSEQRKLQLEADLDNVQNSAASQREQHAEEYSQLASQLCKQEKEAAEVAAQRNQLSQECSAHAQTASELQERLASAESAIAQDHAKVESITALLDAEKQRACHLEQLKEESAEHVTQLHSKVSCLEDALEQQQGVAQTALADQVVAYNETVAKLEQMEQATAQQTAETSAQIEQLSADLTASKQLICELREQCAAASGSMQDLDEQLRCATREKSLADELASTLQQRLAEREESEASLGHKLQDANSEKDSLLASLNASRIACDELQCHVNESRDEKTQLQEELGAANDALHVVSEDRDRLNSEHERLRSCLHDVEENSVRAMTDFEETLAEQRTTLSATIGDLKSELLSAADHLAEEQSKAASSAQMLDVERNRIIALDAEKSDLVKKSAQFQAHAATLEETIRSQQNTLQENEAERTETKRQHAETLLDLEHAMAEADQHHRQELDRLLRELAVAKEDADGVTDQLRATKTLVGELRESCNSIELEKQDALCRAASLEAERLKNETALAELEVQRCTLTDQVTAATDAMRQKQNDLTDVELHVHSERQKCTALAQEIVTLQATETTLNEKIADLLVVQDNSTASLKTAQSMCTDLEDQLRTVRSSESCLGDDLNVTKQSLYNANAELAEVRARLLSSEQNYGNAQTSAERLTGDLQDLQSSWNAERQALSSDLASSLRTCDEWNSKFDHLRSSADELETQLLASNESCDKKQVEIVALSEKLAASERDLAVMSAESDSLQSQTANLEETLADVHTRYNDIEQQHADCAAVSAQQEDRLRSAETALAQATAEVASASKHLQDERDRLCSLEAEKNRITEQSGVLESRISQLEEALGQQQAIAGGLQGTLDEMERHHADDLSSATSRIEELCQQLDRAGTENQDMCEQISCLTGQCEQMDAGVGQLKSELAASLGHAEQLSEKVKCQEAEVSSYNSQLTSVEQECERLRQTEALHKGSQTEAKLRASQLETERDDLHATVGAVRKSYADLELRYATAESCRATLEQELEQRNEKSDHLAAEVQELMTKLSTSETCVQRATCLFEESRQDLTVAQEAWDLERQGLMERLAEAGRVHSDLTNQLKKAEENICRLQSRLADAAERDDKNARELIALQERFDVSDQDRKTLTLDNGQLQEDCRRLQASLAQQEEKTKNLTGQCMDYVARCEQSAEEIAGLNEKLACGQPELEQALSGINSAMHLLESERQQVAMLMQDNAEQSATISQLQDNTCKLEEVLQEKEQAHDKAISSIEEAASAKESELQQHVERLSLDLAEMQTTSRSASDELSTSQELVAELRQSLTVVEQGKNDCQDQICSLVADVSQKNEELEQLATQHTALTQQMGSAHDRIGHQEQDIAMYTGQLQESQKECKRLEEKLECMLQSESAAQQQSDKLREEMSTISNTLAAAEASRQELAEVFEQSLADKQQLSEELAQARDTLNTTHAGMTADLSSSQDFIKRLQSQLQESVSDMQVAEDAWQLERQGMADRLAEVQKVRTDLLEQHSAMTETIVALKDDVANVKSNAEQSRSEAVCLGEQLAAAKQELEALQEDREKYSDQRSRMESTLAQEQELTSLAQEQCSMLSKKCEEYAEEVAALKEKLECGQPELQQALSGINSAMVLLESERERVTILEQEDSDRSAQISQLRDDISVLEKTLAEQRQVHDGALSSIQETASAKESELHQQVGTLSSELSEMQKSVTSVSEKLSTSEGFMAELRQSLTVVEREKEDCQNQIYSLVADVSQKNEEVEQLTAKQTALTHQLDSAHDRIGHQEHDIAMYTGQLQESQQECKRLKEKLECMLQSESAAQQQSDKLREEMSTISNTLAAAEASRQELAEVFEQSLADKQQLSEELAQARDTLNTTQAGMTADLSSSQDFIKRLQSQLQESVSDMQVAEDAWQLERQGMADRLAEVQKVRTDLLEQHSAMTETIVALKDDVANVKSNAEQSRSEAVCLGEQLAAAKQELEVLQEDREKYNDERSRMESTLAQEQELMSQAQEQCSMLSKKCEEYAEEVAALKEKLECGQPELQQALSGIDSAMVLLESERERVTTLEQENSDRSAQISQLRDDISVLEKTLAEQRQVHDGALSSIQETASAKESELHKQVRTLSSELSEMQKTAVSLTDKLSTSEDLVVELRQSLSSAEQQKNDCQDQICSLTADLSQKNEDLRQLEAEHSSLATQLSAAHEKEMLLRSESDLASEKNLEEIRAEKDSALESLSASNQCRGELETQLSTAREECAYASEQLSLMRQAKEDTQCQIDELRNKLLSAEESAADNERLLEESVIAMKTAMGLWQSERASLTERTTAAESSCDELSAQNADNMSVVADLKTRLAKAESQCTHAAEEVQQLAEESDRAKNQLSTMCREREELEESLRTLQLSAAEHDENCTSATLRYDTLNQQCDAYTARISELNATVKELEISLESSKAEAQQVLAEQTDRYTSLAEAQSAIESEKEDFIAQVAALQESLQEQVAATAAAKEEYKEKRTSSCLHCDRFKVEQKSLNSEVEHLEKQVDKLSTDLFEVHERCSLLSSERDAALKKLDSVSAMPIPTVHQADSGAQPDTAQSQAAMREEVQRLQAALQERDEQIDLERRQVVAAAEAFIAEREAEFAAATQQAKHSSTDSASAVARAEAAEIEIAQLRHDLLQERQAKATLLATAEEQQQAGLQTGLKTTSSGSDPSLDVVTKLDKLQSRCAHLEQELESGRLELKTAQADATEKVQTSKSRVALLEKEMTGLSSSLKDVQCENDRMVEVVKSLRAEVSSLEGMRAEASRASEALSEVELNLRKQVDENKELHNDIGMLQQRCAELKDTAVARRRSVLRERDNLVAALRDRESHDASLVSELKDKCEQLQKENKELVVAGSKPVSVKLATTPDRQGSVGKVKLCVAADASVESLPEERSEALDMPPPPPPAAASTSPAASSTASVPASTNTPAAALSHEKSPKSPAEKGSSLTCAELMAQSQSVVRQGLPHTVSRGLLDIPTGCVTSPMIVRRTTRSAALLGKSNLLGLAGTLATSTALPAAPSACLNKVEAASAGSRPSSTEPVKLLSPRRRPRPVKRKNDENSGGVMKKGTSTVEQRSSKPQNPPVGSSSVSSSVLSERNVPSSRVAASSVPAATDCTKSSLTAAMKSTAVLQSNVPVAAAAAVKPSSASAPAVEPVAAAAAVSTTEATAANSGAKPVSSLAPPARRSTRRRAPAAPAQPEPEQCKTQ